MSSSPPVLLDGASVASSRVPELARRAAAVTARRGFPPRLALVAFADVSSAPRFTGRKVDACRQAGIDAVPRILPTDTSTGDAAQVVGRVATKAGCDGIFLEFPFPQHVDADALIETVPAEFDVDVMTSARIRSYMSEQRGKPPVTVEAALVLLDHVGVDVRGLDGVVIAEESPFALMFREALARRGADMRPLLAPQRAHTARDAQLLVSAAAQPALLRSEELATDAVVIDAGYYNAGGRGDIDTAGGVVHLRALAPVPGAIGPMTVSMLMQRVLEAAEQG